MDEKLLLRLSLISSAIGIIVLFVIAHNIEINDTTIRKITSENIEGTTTVAGTVTQVNAGEKFSSIILMQEESLVVNLYGNVNVKIGDKIRVTGRIEDGVMIADKIT